MKPTAENARSARAALEAYRLVLEQAGVRLPDVAGDLLAGSIEDFRRMEIEAGEREAEQPAVKAFGRIAF